MAGGLTSVAADRVDPMVLAALAPGKKVGLRGGADKRVVPERGGPEHVDPKVEPVLPCTGMANTQVDNMVARRTQVKELAQETSRSTEEISGQIDQIQTASGQTAASISEIGAVISDSMVPLRLSSAISRMVITGVMKSRVNQKKKLPKK